MATSQTAPSDLIHIASALCTTGKGILASDESPGTLGRRLERHGVSNTEETRRSYRDLFYSAPGLGDGIAGAILFPEALHQSSTYLMGKTFVQCLEEASIIPGVKVDQGLRPLDTSGALPGETDTKGLDGLYARCLEYRNLGARFAKWRAALRVIDDGRKGPSDAALDRNGAQLAEYAAICQSAGLVPIVEPEILIDGNYTVEEAEVASMRTMHACISHLWRKNVLLEGALLKPQMIVAGAACPADFKPSSEEIATRTLRVMRRTVPPAIPGIMFLSGGQTEEEATANLNTINQLARTTGDCAPWALSFSFGRALQASVLKLWTGNAGNWSDSGKKAGDCQVGNEDACRNVAAALGRANGLATKGEFEGRHPSVLGSGSTLHETFRGWQGREGPVLAS